MVHSSKARASVRNIVQGRRSHMEMSTTSSWSKLRWGLLLVDFFFLAPKFNCICTLWRALCYLSDFSTKTFCLIVRQLT